MYIFSVFRYIRKAKYIKALDLLKEIMDNDSYNQLENSIKWVNHYAKALCHQKKGELIIALQELLNGQKHQENEKIKAEIKKTAEMIKNIDLNKLKGLKLYDAEKHYLSYFGYNQDIELIYFPIKKYLRNTETEWKNDVLQQINALSFKIGELNKKKLLSSTVFQI